MALVRDRTWNFFPSYDSSQPNRHVYSLMRCFCHVFLVFGQLCTHSHHDHAGGNDRLKDLVEAFRDACSQELRTRLASMRPAASVAGEAGEVGKGAGKGGGKPCAVELGQVAVNIEPGAASGGNTEGALGEQEEEEGVQVVDGGVEDEKGRDRFGVQHAEEALLRQHGQWAGREVKVVDFKSLGFEMRQRQKEDVCLLEPQPCSAALADDSLCVTAVPLGGWHDRDHVVFLLNASTQQPTPGAASVKGAPNDAPTEAHSMSTANRQCPLPAPGRRALFSGDAVFMGSVGNAFQVRNGCFIVWWPTGMSFVYFVVVWLC